jgi:dolichol-phosphate mannosyltransferase
VLYILLAAYNEEKNFPLIFEDIKKQKWQFDYNIIIVNDGSSDNTNQVAVDYSKQLPITVISHEHNMGLGKALLTGFTYLNNTIKNGDFVATFDADNSHPVEIISSMLNKIEPDYDLVVASRYCSGGGQKGLGFIRKILSSWASSFLAVIWPIKHIRDYSCGFRMYRGSLIKSLFAKFGDKFIEESGFSASIEILLKASLITDKFIEVPMILRYDKKIGASKMKIFRTIFRYLALLTKLKSS